MAKKSFMNADNPAMQFISEPLSMPSEEEPAKESPVEKPMEKTPEDNPQASKADAFDIAPKSAEHKSKRAQLLMTPSLHQKVCKKADSLNMSFNELVNLVLENYVQ